MPDDVLQVDDQLELRPVTRALVPSLVEAVRTSQRHLWPWMVWASEGYDASDAATFVGLVESGQEEGFAISERGADAFHGLCGLNRLDGMNHTANLGYWLRAGSTGRGLATRAVRRLLLHGLEELDLERIEIVMSVANAASAEVPLRLGLHEEGIRRRALRVGDEQHDARVFAAFPADLRRLRSGHPAR